MPVVLYGCETWCFILREEDRLRVFDNRVLRKIRREAWNEYTKHYCRTTLVLEIIQHSTIRVTY